MLKTPSKQRSHKQLLVLLPLIAKTSFFKDLGLSRSAMLDLALSMEYQTAAKDNYLFEFGDTGNHLFVILTGVVEVQILSEPNRKEFDAINNEIK